MHVRHMALEALEAGLVDLPFVGHPSGVTSMRTVNGEGRGEFVAGMAAPGCRWFRTACWRPTGPHPRWHPARPGRRDFDVRSPLLTCAECDRAAPTTRGRSSVSRATIGVGFMSPKRARRGDVAGVSLGAAILILGQELRPYLLEEAARQPEPLRCLLRKTRLHGIPPMWSSGPRLGSRSKEWTMPEQTRSPWVDTKRAESRGQRTRARS